MTTPPNCVTTPVSPAATMPSESSSGNNTMAATMMRPLRTQFGTYRTFRPSGLTFAQTRAALAASRTNALKSIARSLRA